VDGGLFDLALAIAADRTVGTAVRVQAMLVVLNQIEPGNRETFENMVSEHPELLLGTSGALWSVTTPLPSDALERTQAALESVAEDPSATRDVRTAARRLAASARAELGLRQHCTPDIGYGECLRRRTGL
jgi:hypothetical protein